MDDFLWYKVLNYWCNIRTPIGSGLTIPFLVGVEKKYGRGDDFNTNLLLDEFNTIDTEQSVIVSYCNNIGMDVCSLEELSKLEKNYYKKLETLFLGVGEYKDLESFEEFKKVIYDEYLIYIEEEKYSINNGKWTDFTQIDLEWLNDVE
jgi:hypothetical protein